MTRPIASGGEGSIGTLPLGFETKVEHRERLGYAFLGVGVVVILGAVITAYYGIDRATLPTIAPPDEHLRESLDVLRVREQLMYVKLGAHAVVSVALVLFGYAAVRAGERMLLPRWLIIDSTHVEMVRALLGFRAPLAGALRTIERLAESLSKITKPFLHEAPKKEGGGD